MREDEARCHRSVLRELLELLAARGARATCLDT
jgi:hypothetical protein